MSLTKFISIIEDRLSGNADVLTDRTDPSFWITPKRWSDVGLKIPGAIIRPGGESDVIEVVKSAAITSTPFVAATGGHSPWSSIDENGFILDMSRFKGVEVSCDHGTAKVRGGLLQRELQAALADHARFTTVGDSHTVGVIPYFIGGGISLFSGLFGSGAENILSARIILADGSLIEASETVVPELFWAIRGAGQFFGVVTELTIRVYPLSSFGMIEGHFCGQFIFPICRAEAVCEVMEELMVDGSKPTAGHMMILTRPPEYEQVIWINAHYLGDSVEGPSAFQKLSDLDPIEATSRIIAFQDHGKSSLLTSSSGRFRSINLTGLDTFSSKKFLKLAKLHEDLISKCPDAQATQIIIGWRSPVVRLPETDTSFGNTGRLLWQ
ncbi:FAD binding domain-containing protein [Penicillium ucsense]|uniref:FAD binding domain-containing protein n=1 Tax=Penicillium ucsense TaxID=2839758 RepID=A0A8J8W8X1_9EURO|nr:FAD binding domain-containing protein [Penicillium ucsense]KAF7739324.1 FAD binding domain-containing protein [Penicillium ucsense]